eukprot:CAMPEP_0175113046 /NCGR_PEP_ID=MMETSP0086_2-20121207/15904_1 /TAXON_ID=136419 /ORGANISM="Unknown Unknown, Strain D1" /LENGTH=77 /DNA_ID=CAMNT_0016392183 /DNA_START=282 /DNA_END=513 /DNA_ORIENTATION=-
MSHPICLAARRMAAVTAKKICQLEFTNPNKQDRGGKKRGWPFTLSTLLVSDVVAIAEVGEVEFLAMKVKLGLAVAAR